MVLGFAKSLRHHAVGQISSLHHEHDSYRWWVLANVMIGTFMAVLDATIVNVALPKIMGVFGISIDQVEWVVTAYMLIFAIMLPTSGWIADHFGYKRTYLLALFMFTLGSFLCSISWNENALIFFRIVQGLGAGMMMPVGMAIVTREFPVKQRGMAIGFWSIAAAASVSLGPMVGGYLVDNFAWHTIFDVNVPVGMLAIVATIIIQREYRTEKARSFDLAGFLALGLFLTALLLALTNGNAAWNTGGWTSTYILTCFALAIIGLVVFLIIEFSVAHPLIDLSLFRNYNFSLANLVLFIFGLGMFGSTFLLPLFLQNSLGYTAFQAGMLFLPTGLLQGLFSPIAGILSDRINPKIPALIGVVLMGLSFHMNHFLSLFSERGEILVSLYVRGLAMGLLFTPLSTMALKEIPRHKMAQASGMFNVIRQIGGSMGVAIFGSILTQRVLFHSAIFGGAVNQYAPVFKNTVMRLQYFAQRVGGGTTAVASQRARSLAGAHIAQQAFATSIGDDFLIASFVTLACVVVILFLRVKKTKSGPGPQAPALE
jgi:MFS transporter, DHA2 family, multidrug resistance protein